MPQYPKGVPVPPAQVSQSNENFDNVTSDGKFATPPDNGSVYPTYKVRHRYEGDPHIYMLGTTADPTASPYSDPVAFVQLSQETRLWICEWSATRWGEKPKMPDYRIADTGWVFMKAIFQPEQTLVGADGVSVVYKVSGTYIYGRRRPSPLITSEMTFPVPPFFDGITNTERSFSADMFQQGIIQPPGGQLTAPSGGVYIGPFPS